VKYEMNMMLLRWLP